MTLTPEGLPIQGHGQPALPDPRAVLRDAYRGVLAFFRRRVSTEALALELTNETFLRLRIWQCSNCGLMPDGLMGFLFWHAEWVRCDHFRKQAKIRDAEQLTGDSVDMAALENGRLLASVSLPQRLTDVARTIDLKRAVAALSEKKRLALVLRYVDDLPTGQIANVLGITPQAVNQMIKTTIAELSGSEHLAGYAPRGGHQ